MGLKGAIKMNQELSTRADRTNFGVPLPTHLWRAVAVKVRSFVEGKPLEQIAKELYPGDPIVPMILRAASAQATLTDAAWAGPLAKASVSQAVQETVSMSVIGRLIAAGALRIDLARSASVTVPGRSTTPASAGAWVAEGGVIPARQYNLLGPTLRPHKLSVITTFSREMTDASNIEEILRALIIEAAGPAIDAAVLSAAAASPQKSAGLLLGLTPLAAAAGTFGFDNIGLDLGKLVGDIATRGGGAHAFFTASPGQATAIRFYAGGQFGVSVDQDILPVGGSSALADGTVIAIEPSSFATTVGMPEFEVGTVATIHQEDTAPADIGRLPGASGPNIVAAPVKSMFQIDAIALKMTLWGDWCMRAPHVSFMNAVTW
jgi:hypothetical protein